jgi:hypothetical protein
MRGSDSNGPGAASLVSVQAPSILNHQFEVVIVVDRDTDVIVVLEELLQSDGSVPRVPVLNQSFSR